MTLKYFNVKNGLVTGNITLDASNSNVSGNYFIGNISVTSKANLGANANVTITGGSSGQLLATDGSGNLYWAAPAGGGGIGGSNTYVQFNDSGTYGGNANFTFDKSTGVVSASHFSGEAGNLSNIQAANISGAISYATTANSVAGANVTGAVAYATTANSVAGANVSGAVAYATTANSVAGANVSGEVSFAATANSVAGANVSGAVGLATYATTANSVAGANVSGAVAYATTANSVAGANVSGQVANALVAGTVYTAAQPNITSVGTLTSLDVSGGLTVGGNLTVNGTLTSINSTIVEIDDLALVLANDASTGTQANGAGIIINGASANMLYISSTNSFTFSHKISADGGLLSNITGANVTGFVANANVANTAYAVAGANVTGQVGNALVASTVYTAAQPNITSVGTLTDLAVSGISNLGPAGNVIISGGTSGQFLKTDGTGNLTWASASAGSAATITYTPAFKGALLFAAANTAMSAATWTKVSFTTVSYDTTGGALTGTASRFTIPAGVSKIKLKGQVTGSSATDQFITVFYKNGAGIGAATTVDIDSSGQDSSPSFSAVLPVAQSDYFELWAYSTLARDALNVAATWFSIEIVEGSILNTTVSTTIGMSTLSDVDVSTSSPANGQALIWSSASSKWIPSNASNLTSVGTLSNLAVTGNITSGNANLGNLVTANFFSGNGSALTAIAGANVSGAVSFATTANAVAGANVSGQVGNALVAGTVYTAAQPNITSVGTLTSLEVTGNISSGNANLGNLVTANFFSGNGHYLTDILGTQISGEVAYANKANSVAGANVTGQVSNALVAGTVYASAQPNITSTGTLTSVTVSGTSTLGDVGNVKITGGTTGQYLQTDGTGNLSWSTVTSSGGVAGSNTQVIFNDAGAYAGNAGFTFDKANTKLIANNFAVTSTANLGAVGNVIITGGSTGQVLKTDGSGGLSWGTAAGSESTVTSVDNFTGDGTTTDFTLSVTPANKNQTLVNYNGAMQLKAAYSLSGAVITFSEAPANGSLIEVITQMGVTTGAGNLTVRTFSGTGSQTDFSVSSGVNATNILVTENGVLQVPTTDYTVSSGTLSFVVAPASGVNIQVRELGTSISTITPAGSDTQVLFNDAGSFGNSASFTFNKTSKTLTTGSILPATDLTYSLGNSTRRWSNLYLAGNTIHLGNATISVDDTTGAVMMTPAPTVANPSPVAQTVTAPRYVTMVTTGSITTPKVGTSRYYPPANISISSVTASLSTPATDDFVFVITKNGTTVDTYTMSSGTYKLTPTSVTLSVTTTDYLMVNITSGTGASDLRMDLAYTFT